MKNKVPILLLTVLLVGSLVFGRGLSSADDDSVPNCDVTVSPGESIQDAIDVADPGVTICVEPGTYTEDLSITRSLELVGLKTEDGFFLDDRPVIEGISTVPAGQFPLARPNINIQANNVYIHGFTIKSPQVAADEYSSGIVLTGREIEIYDNMFYVGTGDVSQGIQTYRQDIAPEGLRDISGLQIYKNSFTNLGPATGVGAYEGIFINPQSDDIDLGDPADKIIIQKNRFFGKLIRAVTTQRSGTEIAKNRISTDWVSITGLESFPRGIQLSKAGEAPPLPAAESSGHRVVKNRIVHTGASTFYTGILVRDEVTDCVIKKNFVNGTANNGIELGLSNFNKVSKNSIKASGQDGLFVNGDGNFLEKNQIRDSGQYGLHLGIESEENLVEKNRVMGSGVLDIFDEGTDNLFVKNKCSSGCP
jgi:hypothetical protein